MRSDVKLGVIILSYGREGELPTIKALEKSGWGEGALILVDDEDERLADYRSRYKENVRVFSKREIRKIIDIGDNRKENNAAILARWAAIDVGKKEGYDYLLVCDDDITGFNLSLTNSNEDVHRTLIIKDLERWIWAMKNWMCKIGIKSIGFDTCGQLIGGMGAGEIRQFWRRRVAQAYIIDVNMPLMFKGRSQEDLCGSVLEAMRGELLASIGAARIMTKAVETMNGGMTGAYKDMGQAAKNLYPIMYCPSAIMCYTMRNAAMGVRTHIKVKHNNAYPKLIDYDYCK